MTEPYYYYYNGEIVTTFQKAFNRELIWELVGSHFFCLAYKFPHLHTQALWARNGDAKHLIVLPGGEEVRTNFLICNFYFPLYQWQAMELSDLEIAVSAITYQQII